MFSVGFISSLPQLAWDKRQVVVVVVMLTRFEEQGSLCVMNNEFFNMPFKVVLV
jgi:hypothetical protein